MKLYVKNRKKNKANTRGELVIDVGGLTEWEAEEFIEQVQRRVTIKTSRNDPARIGDKRSIDVNININRD